MDAHGVWKGCPEEVVVTASNFAQDVCQGRYFGIGQVLEGPEKALVRQHHDFKRPYSPKRHESDEIVVESYDTWSSWGVEFHVRVRQEEMWAPVRVARAWCMFVGWIGAKVIHAFHDLHRLAGHVIECPDLAVRMWIAASHGAAFVLKELDVLNKRVFSSDAHVHIAPRMYNRDDVGLGTVRRRCHLC